MFYLLNIETYSDTPISKSVYQYDDQSTAVASFHSRIGAAMKNEKCVSVLCKVMTETGVEIKSEFWARPEQ